MFLKIKNKKLSGFTLVEALVILLIFSLITMTFYYVISLGTRYIQEAKNRLGAVSLANEKMEIIRNLSYANIGISGGIPAGNIPQDEDVTENTRSYHVHTFVEFIDDPLDGTYPTDTIPDDYKRVKVTVSWQNSHAAESISLVSRFVPPGMETMTGDGILAINIIDGQNNGNGVSEANVHIVNSSVSPAVNITTQTDTQGHLMLPGAKASSQKYQITTSAQGYETVTTVDPTTVNYKPTDYNASVALSGPINPASITINKVSNLKIIAVDYLDNPLAVSFGYHLEGGRIIGTELLPPFSPVYNMKVDDSTDASGEKDYTGISPGQYTLTLPQAVTGYELIGIDPASFPFSLLPASSAAFKVKLANQSATSILVSVINNAGGLPVSGASVELSNSSGYDVTQTTGNDGKAFFPETQDVFQSGNYNLKVTASGFQDNNSQVNISSNHLLDDTVTLSTP